VIGLDATGEIRILAPNGVLGSGFEESSFEAGLARHPHFIGVDAGSTDGGPSSLGSGKTGFARKAIKRDMRIALRGARRLGIPFLIGVMRHRRRRPASGDLRRDRQ
jgi:hypothetical protein